MSTTLTPGELIAITLQGDNHTNWVGEVVSVGRTAIRLRITTAVLNAEDNFVDEILVPWHRIEWIECRPEAAS